jgi:hypothetical protein
MERRSGEVVFTTPKIGGDNLEELSQSLQFNLWVGETHEHAVALRREVNINPILVSYAIIFTEKENLNSAPSTPGFADRKRGHFLFSRFRSIPQIL